MDGFERWKIGIDRANVEWDRYDPEIRRTVFEYSQHLLDTPGFTPLDWGLVKAMLWTESGPQASDWKKTPLQIGVPGDPGLRALLYGDEGSELIVPPCYVLTATGVTTQPRMNIVAALGYLLMRMANYGFATLPDDANVFNITASVGDSLSTLARKNRSTIETLQKLNSGVQVIRAGQVLRCQRASIRKVIVGWKPFTFSTVAQRYNGNGNPKGDPSYSKKLAYSMDAIKRRGATK